MKDDNFFSLDKLVELGISINIANEMVSTMNNSLTQEKLNIEASSKYFVVHNDNVFGPYLVSEIIQMISEKIIFKETYVWKEGMQYWDIVSNIKELNIINFSGPPKIK